MLVNEIELDPLRKIPFKQGSKINWVGPTDVTLDTFSMYFGAYFMLVFEYCCFYTKLLETLKKINLQFVLNGNKMIRIYAKKH